MRKKYQSKIFFGLFYLFLIFITFLFIVLIKNKTKSIIQQKKTVEQKKILLSPFPSTTVSNQPIQENQPFFSYQKTKINDNFYLIKIFLNNEKNTLFDAVDLSLQFDKNKIEIIEIQNGDTFSEYPRKSVNVNNLIVTGIASIKDEKIKYASASSFYTGIVIKKLSTLYPAELMIDKKNSGIYYSGENIADFNKSFVSIDL